MTRTWADNAVMAKVRALYGKRLTSADYDQLLGKKSVGEVAAYLKRETYYSQALQEVREDLIHRGQLEHLVRRRVLDTHAALMKYTRGDSLYMALYVMENEITQLVTAIRLLGSGAIDRYIIALPLYLQKLFSYDLLAVAKVRSYDELLAALAHSPYEAILRRFRPAAPTGKVDITACESALLTHYYTRALAIARRDYRSDAREDLERLLYLRLYLHNLLLIYRMRRFLGVPADMVRGRIVLVEGDRSQKLYHRLLEAPDPAAMRGILREQRYFRGLPPDWLESTAHIDGRVALIEEGLSRRSFRFSVHPVVVVISYMTLLGIEIRNIVNITEGIRYNLSPGEIRELLTL